MTLWSMRVDEFTDIYSETRVVDMLRTVDNVAVDRACDQDGKGYLSLEAPGRAAAKLVREMVSLIDPHAIVSRVRLHAGAAF